jgi:hypothetical protein
VATPTLVLLAATALALCVLFGATLYETVVLDPRWPARPGIVQPRNGGVSRRRFWLPVPPIADVLLVLSLVCAWADTAVRAALLMAVVAHAVARVWWLAHLGPRAAVVERTDPADVDETDARRWTRAALARLPLLAVAASAALAALAMA